jgi:MFS transporter, DHA1 family, tetracycline resistance protein
MNATNNQSIAIAKDKISSFIPLFLVLFIDSMGMGILFPILAVAFMNPSAHFLAVSTTHSMRTFEYGIVISVFMLCWFVGAAVLGEYSDIKGRKPCLLICLAGATVGYVLSFLALITQSLWLLILGRIIAGLTAGSQSIAQASIVDGSSAEKLNRNMGYTVMVICFGFVAGPVIGGVFSDTALVSWFNISTPMFVAAILSFINLVLLCFLFRELRTHKSSREVSLVKTFATSFGAFRRPGLGFLCVVFVIFICGWSNYYSFISVYLVSAFHYSALKNALFSACLGAGFCLGSGYLNNRLNMFSSKYIAVGAILASSAVVFLTMFASSQALIWAYAFIIGTAIAVAYPNILTLFSRQVNEDEQGWVMGVNGSMMALSFGLSTLLTGFIGGLWVLMPLLIATVGLLLSGLLLLPRKY